MLAYRKLTEQNGEISFFEPELNKTFQVEDVDIDLGIEEGWAYYTKKESHIDWMPLDKKHCKKSVETVRDFNNGMFYPPNRHILYPEKYFDFDVDEDWGRYEYQVGDKVLNGTLALRGTIDLVTQLTPNTIELIDWKTGQAKDWNTGKRKDYDGVHKDSQLRLYHLALCRLFPQIEHIIITIFYINDGGPTSVCFSRSDLPETVEMIRKKFEEVKGIKRPKIITRGRDLWKCKHLCKFYKEKQEGSDKSICRFFKGEIEKLGIDKVTEQYADLDKLTKYGEGGGKSTETERKIN